VTNSEVAAESAGPTIVLVGGPMTVDDGTTLDTRQPIVGDADSQMTRRCLESSWLWWMTVSSLVNPMLSSAKEGAFALVIGSRSAVELRQDGTIRRRSLRALLPGGGTTVQVVRTGIGEALSDEYEPVTTLRNWNGDGLGTVGLKRGSPRRSWWFLDGNEYYLEFAGPQLAPSVIIDTSDSLTIGDVDSATRFQALGQRRLFAEDLVLVLPHTHRAEELIRGYLDWTGTGRIPQVREGLAPAEAWDPAKPPDPIRYTTPVPISASFQVTGLAYGKRWQDPSHLEAARRLLQTRYDLKIGIWDLAHNAVLRQTLLDAIPVEQAPSEVAAVPAGPAERADRHVTKKLALAEEENKARRRISRQLKPLRLAGWVSAGPGSLELALTEQLHRWPGDDAIPLVRLDLMISKRQTTVSAWTAMYNDVDISRYLRDRTSTLAAIAAPQTLDLADRRSILWRAPGGWADPVEWEARAEDLATRTPDWAELLKALCDECLRLQRARFAPTA
jgi:hypothetical protein